MLERVNPNVFKTKRSEIKKNLTGIIDTISQLLQCDYRAIIIQKRDDTAINGSAPIIVGVDVDYRSEALIIVKPVGVYDSIDYE